MPISTSTARLSCLCGAVREPGTLLSGSSLPLSGPEVEMCHCNACRYTTGALGITFVSLRESPSATALAACTIYRSSETHDRYFCARCGTGLFMEEINAKGEGKGAWYCFAGTVERDPALVSEVEEWARDVVKLERHGWVGDTGDGGIAAARLLRVGGRDVLCYEEGSGSGTQGSVAEMNRDKLVAMQAAAEKDSIAGPEHGELMEARCRCGGVDLKVTKADFEKDAQGLSSVFTEAGNRYLAQFCACRSCRLQSGVNYQPWTYIPPQNFMVAKTGKRVVFGREAGQEGMNEGLPTLKHYWSKKDVCRSFCGRCGASVFYWADGRPEVVDLSIGLIRARTGCMAREWVSWRWRVSWKEECVDEEIMETIIKEG